MSKRKIFFIINPAAGNTKSKNYIELINNEIKVYDSTISLEIISTNAPKDAIKLSADAIKSNFDTIVAVGGDGTIHEIIQSIAENDKVSLGIIPTGSGNDFIKNFDINKNNFRENIKTIIDNKKKKVDLAKINDWYFINTAGIGFSTKIIENSTSKRKNYFLNAIKNIVNFKPFEVRIELDNYSLIGDILILEIGNGKSSGGKFLLNPSALVDDGYLNLCIIFSLNIMKRIKVFNKIFFKKNLDDDKITFLKTKKLKITSPYFKKIHCDGEFYELKNGIANIEILEKKLNILVP